PAPATTVARPSTTTPRGSSPSPVCSASPAPAARLHPTYPSRPRRPSRRRRNPRRYGLGAQARLRHRPQPQPPRRAPVHRLDPGPQSRRGGGRAPRGRGVDGRLPGGGGGLGTPADRQEAVARDRWGRYLLPDPQTGEIRPFTRTTTLAGTITDTYGIHRWEPRGVARGLAA